MQSIFRPIKTAVMEPDYYSLKQITWLLMRDQRTNVCFETGIPARLLHWLADGNQPDVTLVDAEFRCSELSLPELLRQITSLCPNTKILCQSTCGDFSTVKEAVDGGTHGFILKGKVQIAIATYVQVVKKDQWVSTMGVDDALMQLADRNVGEKNQIPAWEPHPRLTDRVKEAFELKVVWGMQAKTVGEVMGVAPNTVSQYCTNAYKMLEDYHADTRYLEGLPITELSKEDQAFHRYVLPPRRFSP